MPHPITQIAISLAPYAADLLTKIVGYKKDAKSNNNIEERLGRLEDYEVQQAKLVKELAEKVEQLQNRYKRLYSAFVFVILFAAALVVGSIFLYFTAA